MPVQGGGGGGGEASRFLISHCLWSFSSDISEGVNNKEQRKVSSCIMLLLCVLLSL